MIERAATAEGQLISKPGARDWGEIVGYVSDPDNISWLAHLTANKFETAIGNSA